MRHFPGVAWILTEITDFVSSGPTKLPPTDRLIGRFLAKDRFAPAALIIR